MAMDSKHHENQAKGSECTRTPRLAGRRRELRKMGLGLSKAPSDGKRTWLAPLHWATQIHTT